MFRKQEIKYKITAIILIICLTIPNLILCIPSIADTSDYSLTDKNVTLDGENDGEVEISLITAGGGTFYALQAVWTLSENEGTNYFTLNDLTAGADCTTYENDPTSGSIYCEDMSGFEILTGGSIWTATYAIDADTPSGTYTVSLSVKAIVGGESINVSDENFTLTATITVSRVDDPLTATFETDEGVASIDIYYTQDYNAADEKDVTKAYARDGSTGEILSDGEGQINFLVNLEDGYSISSVTIDNEDGYKKLKDSSDTGVENMYRITKISSELTITITTTQDPYTATFVTDDGVSSIDIYYTQNYTTADEENVTTAIARNSDTGSQDTSGSGQINFLINLKDNYLIKSVTVENNSNYNNLKDSSDTGVDNMYRITKITGDLTVTITTKERESIVPDITGYDTSYEYTGSSIEPEITVNIYGTATTLTEDTDYTVTYGTNTEIGTGTITISSISTSEYVFTDTTVYFSIVAKTLTNDDVTVPASITYTGSDLSPDVVVYTNGTTLQKGTDYTVTYYNQDGEEGEYVTVEVTGIGNYQGTVTKTVLITPKPSRDVTVADLTLIYGDTKTYTDNEDCEVTYTSSDDTIVSVTHSYSSGTSTNKLTAVSTGEVVITAIYAETDDYAKTLITFKVTVEQKELTITDVTVRDKQYDETTDAEVTNVKFDGVLSTDTLTLGDNYSAEGTFSSSSAGEDKKVTVTVTLLGETYENYTLSSNIYYATANIATIEIEDDDVKIQTTSYTYDGTAKEPEISVEVDGSALTQNVDYTITYEDNVDAGTANVIVSGIGNYSGTVTKTFEISKKTITPTVNDIDAVIYNASAQEPGVTVMDGTTTLTEGVDYTVTYTYNTNVGTATATISALSTGNYSFEDIIRTFSINIYTLTDSDVSLEYTTVRYNGTEKQPAVTVTINGTIMSESEYDVEYSNNTEIGTATVTITATGSNFTGEIIKTFSIIDKDVLTISGISDNQSIVYTGNEVVLEGTLTVSENDNEITADDLTVVWYDESGSEISQPTDVGSYSVTYSYSDTDYEGSLTINFSITKATSGTPSEATDGLTAIVGQTLADVSLTTEGLYWVDETTEIAAGSNIYYATYTQNNDTANYTTETVQITVYGKVYINITTSVNGSGGSVSDSIENVLEGTSSTITFTPDVGYEIDNVTVNGTEVSVSDNTLTITAGTVDLEVIVTYKVIQYTITIETTNAETDPSGTIYVDYNSDQNITITANDGYELSSVLVNGTEMIDSLVDGVLTLSNITSDITIVVTAESSESDSSDDSSDSTTSYSSLPDTGDDLLKYVILLVISIAGIIVITKIRDNK